MPVIDDSHIEWAERLLFGSSGIFDDERKVFLREWNSCDLQAVPGSGKTTVLLAKLLILEKVLDTAKSEGVLVISHTNAAVDEIKVKIGKHCPRLFSEPHFIGTIQSFVDRFLAVPYYIHKFGKKPIRIDDEIYKEHHRPNFRFEAWLKNQHFRDKILYESRLIDNETVGYVYTDDVFPLKSKGSNSYQDLLRIKKKCMADGFLSFDDAYLLATEYIDLIPTIISILQKRFHYVFVDEMQDMDKKQYDILEKLFGHPSSSSVLQRIGDANQAIFKEDSNMADIWQPHSLQLELQGSHRLQPQIANVVQRLALKPMNVVGLKSNAAGIPISIKPHLLVYKDSTIEKVIPEYARLILNFRGSGQIPEDAPSVYKAICWTKQKVESTKQRIYSFFPAYDGELTQPKINYGGLESYLFLHRNTYSSIRKNILNAFLFILRKLDIKQSNDRIFTKRTLLAFLKSNHPAAYDRIKLDLYRWCGLILSGQHISALSQIKQFIPDFTQIWNKSHLGALTFISQPYTTTRSTSFQIHTSKPNVCNPHGIPVEVCTIHSAKGQTHTATLYLESFYQRSIGNSGNYESQRLASVLKGNPLPSNAHEFIKQSMKMAYVGFSRPTHLLCFAVHESRFQNHLHDLCTNTWEIIHIVDEK